MAAHRGASTKKDQAIAALLSQPSIALAAQAAGVSESTMHRWLKEPAFAGEYRQARRELVAHAIVSAQ